MTSLFFLLHASWLCRSHIYICTQYTYIHNIHIYTIYIYTVPHFLSAWIHWKYINPFSFSAIPLAGKQVLTGTEIRSEKSSFTDNLVKSWALLAKVSVFMCQKMALRRPKQKNGDHFLSPTTPQNGVQHVCFMRLALLGGF